MSYRYLKYAYNPRNLLTPYKSAEEMQTVAGYKGDN